MKKHASSIDVARLAGVSQTTVSFVLNNKLDQSISEETRAKVLNAAQELRYRSNRLSHGIFRGTTGLIGIVMPQVTDDYFSKILLGIARECNRNGWNVLLTYTPGEGDEDAEPLQSLIEYRVDGIICISSEWGRPSREAWLRELLEKSIACVIIDDRTHADIVDCVVTSDVEESRRAVAHLIASGHGRIAHLSAGSLDTTAVDRREGYTQALMEANIPVSSELIAGDSYSIKDGADAARLLLSLQPRPTAVFAANDGLASEMIKQMRRLGLSSPRDLAVIGYGNTAVARALDLSSIDQDPEEIGRTAFRQVLKRALDPAAPPELRQIACRLVERASTSGE